MNERNHFLKQLYDIEPSGEKNKFNIFNALHNQYDERRLHSRFISYLLSPKSNHGKGHDFLNSFIREILQIEDKYFNLDNIEIMPNEEEKSEFENIDILIKNNNNQAIIIENKIFAPDSNDPTKEEYSGYRGQLERYYKTITTGINKDGNEIDIEWQRDNVFVVYLTLEGRMPSVESCGSLKEDDIIRISYRYEIKRWLKKCVEIAKNHPTLRDSIQQYLDLTIRITSDIEKALQMKDIISNNIDLALETKEEILKLDNFKHIRWHTVANFFFDENGLEKSLIKIGAIFIQQPKYEDITKVTHQEEGIAITKLIVKFRYNNTNLQIVNDVKGFTMGNLDIGKWDYFSNKHVKNIKFCDFEYETTFRIINKEFRGQIIELMINEVKEKYSELKNKFK